MNDDAGLLETQKYYFSMLTFYGIYKRWKYCQKLCKFNIRDQKISSLDNATQL